MGSVLLESNGLELLPRVGGIEFASETKVFGEGTVRAWRTCLLRIHTDTWTSKEHEMVGYRARSLEKGVLMCGHASTSRAPPLLEGYRLTFNWGGARGLWTKETCGAPAGFWVR